DELADLMGATATGEVIEITNASGVTISVSVSGPNPRGFATISGTPLQAQAGIINWSEAVFTINGPVRPGETWNIVLGGVTYSHTADADPTALEVANGLRTDILGDGFNPTVIGSGTPQDPYGVRVTKSSGFTTLFTLVAAG